MVVLVLYRSDSEQNAGAIEFHIGEHIIGRGLPLGCDSRRISRTHASLKLSENGISHLTSMHNNPCFHQAENSKHISIVTNGNSIEISNGDSIGLLTDQYWYKVHILENSLENDENLTPLSQIQEQTALDTTTDETTKVKRESSENETEVENKKCKLEISDENVSSQSENKSVVPESEESSSNETVNVLYQINQDEIKIEIVDENLTEKSECDDTVKEEAINEAPNQETSDETSSEVKTECENSDGSLKNEQISVDENVDPAENKNSEKQEKDGNEPSTSGTNSRIYREKCFYGKSCYRKNPDHRKEFKHPDDADYDSDGDDQNDDKKDRPVCQFDPNCYRRNKLHRQNFKHTNPPVPRSHAGKPKRKVTKKNYKESQDSSDLVDPFIDDGSSDEYQPSDDSDSESEYNSQFD